VSETSPALCAIHESTAESLCVEDAGTECKSESWKDISHNQVKRHHR